MRVWTAGTGAVVATAAIGVLVVALFRAAPVELAYPAERARLLWARRIAARWEGLWNGVAASAENARLRREVAALALARDEAAAVKAENARLREALAYTVREPGRWEAAEVLSAGGGAAGAHRSVRVAKGSLAGIREGAPVAAPGGLVGRVVAVTPHTAEVLLITDAALGVACSLAGDTRLLGILSGGGEEALRLRHVRLPEPVADGAPVVTSGRGGVFPGGLAVGTYIAGADEAAAGGRAQAGLEREGRVRPAVDFTRLEDVFILK